MTDANTRKRSRHFASMLHETPILLKKITFFMILILSAYADDYRTLSAACLFCFVLRFDSRELRRFSEPDLSSPRDPEPSPPPFTLPPQSTPPLPQSGYANPPKFRLKSAVASELGRPVTGATVFPKYSPNVPQMFPKCSPNVPQMFPKCSLMFQQRLMC
jgi:hypothetical protein